MSEEKREFYRIWSHILRDTHILYNLRKASINELTDVASLVHRLMPF